MNLTSLTSFFRKKQKSLSVPDTMLIKKLKGLSTQSDLLIYKDINIYHHTSSYRIGLMLLDPKRGIYLFETKEWTYDELKSSNIQKAQNQDANDNTLAFENTQSIIRQKFNEIIHNDGVPIFNYLLMENLNADEYEHLNDSFKELLPQEKVIFSDSLQTDIFKKLQSASPQDPTLTSIDIILGTLLVQYAMLDDDANVYMSTKEQQNFINSPLPTCSSLRGIYASGKSTLLLLKSILTLFEKDAQHILIIKPTTFACDTLKKKLLDIVEHAIIEIDLTAIEIITPTELINRHRAKVAKAPISHIEIDAKLMKKSFNAADIIMCDDANTLPAEFISYLKHIQLKNRLLLVNEDSSSPLQLSKSFRGENKEVRFYKTTPQAKAMRIISRLLQSNATDIVVVSNSISGEKLKDDLVSYIKQTPQKLDSSLHLLNQDFGNIVLCSYADINSIKANHIILMDLCFNSENSIEYAFNLARLSVDVLYEEDCQEITDLRNRYEQSSKE